MSGLFLRLAAHASGQRGAALHSPAALPYQGAPERLEPLELASDRSALQMDQATATEQPAITPGHEIASRLPSSQWRTVPEIDAMNLQAADQQTPAAAPRTAQAYRETAAASSSGLGRSNTDAVSPAVMTGPIRAAAAQIPQSQADAPSARQQMQAAGPHSPSTPEGSARGDSALTEPAFSRDSSSLPLPSALLSPRPASGKQTAVSAVPVVSTSPSQSPDEVHIHIGRIEVTAIQESAPSKRASRKGAAPLSLDDYLAKRKGDSR